MSIVQSPSDRKSFRIAIVCALPREADAVTLLFEQFWDEERDPYGRADGDTNTYITGRIGEHNIVLAVLPNIGTNSAAAATASLRSSYPNLKLAILVGICGGVPRIDDFDIFLGDVVVSKTIIQYDYGRQYPGHFAVKSTVEDSLGRANRDIRGLLAVFETELMRERLKKEASAHLAKLQETAENKRRRANYQFPGTEKDTLCDPKYAHRHQKDCSLCAYSPDMFCKSVSMASCVEAGCDATRLVSRERSVESWSFRPEIFIGRIGSGNTVMKSGEDRDRVAADHDLIAFEMEGAGAWDEIPCIVVKGVCDYADSHKNKSWQDFAAATAASVAKAILGRYAIHDGDRETALTNDQQWLAGGRAGFHLSPSLPEVMATNHFVARNEVLAEMHRILHRRPGRRTVVVHGLGGMGKTQLAIAYTKRHRSDYTASIWFNARDETSLKQSFRNAATRILQEHPGLVYMQMAVSDKDGDTSHAVKRWLDEPKNDQWLLIYDNYDTPKMEGASAVARVRSGESAVEGNEINQDTVDGYDIRKYLPETDDGAVVVTTRSSTVQIGELLRLKKMSEVEDGLCILESTSGRMGCMTDPSAVALARTLDGLPLALSTAGAYLSQVATSWQQYLEDYEAAWGQLQKVSPRLLTYEDRAMYSTWNVSYESIRRQNEPAAMLLRLWAFFGNEDLWYELLRRGGAADGPKWLRELTETRFTFDAGMRVLCSHGLVEAHSVIGGQTGPESSGYSVHGCVHSWMIHVLNIGRGQELTGVAVKSISRHVPGEDVPEYWLIRRRLLLHADRCRGLVDATAADGVSGAWSSHNLGILYADQGRLNDAETMYERALQGYEKALGGEHTSTLSTVGNLGNLYKDQGRLKEAERMYERALQGYEKTLGGEHTSTLSTVNNLGLLYKDQGRLKEAERMYERALQGKEKAFGGGHTSTLDTVNNLGILYKDQGRLKEAERMYERALQGYEKALGRDGIETYVPFLNTVMNQGRLYAARDQGTRAKECYERALRGDRKVFGGGSDRAKYLERLIDDLGN